MMVSFFFSNKAVGKEQISRMAWSGSLAPRPLTLALRFVNNDYVIAEITFSPAHEVFPWSRATLCGMPV